MSRVKTILVSLKEKQTLIPELVNKMLHSIWNYAFSNFLCCLEKNACCYHLVSEPGNQLLVQLHSVVLWGKYWSLRSNGINENLWLFMARVVIFHCLELQQSDFSPGTSLWEPEPVSPNRRLGTAKGWVSSPLLAPQWEPCSVLASWALVCVHHFPTLVICLSGL